MRWLRRLTDGGLSEIRANEILSLAQESIRLTHPPRESLLPQVDRSLPRAVEGVTSVRCLSAGWNFTLALSEDDTVRAWGKNSSGELGDGTVIDKIAPVRVKGLEGVLAVAAGTMHSLALLRDGAVMAWGANFKTQLGDGTTEDRHLPVAVAGIGQAVTAIAAGSGHSLAALADGSVVGWGDNTNAELGPTADARTWNVPAPIRGLVDSAVCVAAGSGVSAALLADGSVQAWGGTIFGDVGGKVGEIEPHLVSGLPSRIVSVVASHSSVLLLLDNGSVWTYSHPHRQSEGLRRSTQVDLPGQAVSISSSGLNALALMSDGTVIAWGNNDKGQMGIGETPASGIHEPTPVQALASSVRDVSAGRNHCAVVYGDGSVAAWGGDYPLTLSDIEGGDAHIPLGASKLGGRPDLAAGVSWPRLRGTPHALVCQLNLADLSPLDPHRLLPEDGLLSFFYDLHANVSGSKPADMGGWHVAFTRTGSRMERLDFPTELASFMRFRALPLTPSPELTLPGLGAHDLNPWGLDEDEARAYFAASYDYVHEKPLVHRIFGYAQPIQSDMQLQCQLASNGTNDGTPEPYSDPRRADLELGAQEWLLLLQIDSDDDAGMMWGDLGRLYYWIRRDDLLARRFDRSWCVFQCH